MRVRAQSYSTLCNCSLPGSSVHGFSQQGYWSGLPFPPPGDLPNPGIKLTSPTSPELTDEFLYHWATWKALNYIQKVTEINLICKFCVFPPKKDLIYKFSMLKKKNFQVSKNLYILIKTLILCVCVCVLWHLWWRKTHSEPWKYRKYLKLVQKHFLSPGWVFWSCGSLLDLGVFERKRHCFSLNGLPLWVTGRKKKRIIEW